MTNELETMSAARNFRAIASDRLIKAAQLTIYELLDEFIRLSRIIADNRIEADPDDYGVKYTEAGKLAVAELGIVNGAAKARFGIYFCASHDDDF